MEKRGHFASKIGVILASAGSAVGLGNIWRFPTEAGRGGGAAFILIYLICIFVMAMPVMISEFVIGRSSHASSVESFRILAPGKPWIVTGFLSVLSGFLILSYYSVVAGWTLNYTYASLCGTLMHNMDFGAYFQNFVSNSWLPLIFMAAFLLTTHYVVSRGVEKGIERFSKIMMPMLFLIILLLIGCSLTMPGAEKGLEFLLKPDFSKVDIKVVLSAMGQAFFSLSVGIGCLITYSSYFRKETNLVSSAVNVCVIDTLVAICAGFIIFPAVFSAGVEPGAGPGLVFITLPNVFNTSFGTMPVLNYIFSGLFYCLLLLAALTSSISMHEICTAYIHETHRLSRHLSASIVTAVCCLMGTVCSLSFGVLSDVTVAGMGAFDCFDFLVAKLFMPLGGILICIFVGWSMKHAVVREQLGDDGRKMQHCVAAMLLGTIRWIAPVCIGIIFCYELLSK